MSESNACVCACDVCGFHGMAISAGTEASNAACTRRRAEDLVAAAGAAAAKVVELAAVEEVAQFAAGAVVRPGAFEVAARRHCAEGGADFDVSTPADLSVAQRKKILRARLARRAPPFAAPPLARWHAKEAT